jgi:hypothetical protein
MQRQRRGPCLDTDGKHRLPSTGRICAPHTRPRRAARSGPRGREMLRAPEWFDRAGQRCHACGGPRGRARGEQGRGGGESFGTFWIPIAIASGSPRSEPPAAIATPTASPSGRLWMVRAESSNVARSRAASSSAAGRPRSRNRVCAWGTRRSSAAMKPHPSAKPSSTSPSAPPVERGDKQAECSRREHHPGGEAQQGVQGQCARAAKDEHGHPTERGGEPGNDQPKSVSASSGAQANRWPRVIPLGRDRPLAAASAMQAAKPRRASPAGECVVTTDAAPFPREHYRNQKGRPRILARGGWGGPSSVIARPPRSSSAIAHGKAVCGRLLLKRSCAAQRKASTSCEIGQ